MSVRARAAARARALLPRRSAQDKIVEEAYTSLSSRDPVSLVYRNIEEIGGGAYSVVKLARCQPDGEQVVIKRVIEDRRHVRDELGILSSLENDNVVAFLAYFRKQRRLRRGSKLYLVMEYMPTNLLRLQHGGALFIPDVQRYGHQLLLGLAYLHNERICHRNVQPRNMLVDGRVLKLGGFGSAKRLGEQDFDFVRQERDVCAVNYRAPELLFGSLTYSPAVDVWAAGCILAEMIRGLPIFPGINEEEVKDEMCFVLTTPSLDQLRTYNPDIASSELYKLLLYRIPRMAHNVGIRGAPPILINLLNRMLEYSRARRLTALEACDNPFFSTVLGNAR